MAYKILSVAGARPNYMKVAALCEAVRQHNGIDHQQEEIQHILVQTVEDRDANLRDSFFNDLDLPKPDISLRLGPTSQAERTAKLMEAFEKVLLAEKPNVVVVAGDGDSSATCALVSKKTRCSGDNDGFAFTPELAHIESGLRSFNRAMPEEINRIVMDSISDYLFTTEESAHQNLLREGIPQSKIYLVGNVTIDTLLKYRPRAEESAILNDLQLSHQDGVRPYAILTLHQAANVDDSGRFVHIIQSCLEVSHRLPIVFPAHPRALKQIQEADLGDYFVDHFMDGPDPWDSRVRIRLVPPLGYLDFIQLMSHAKVVLTDSVGIQEETTVLGVPCLTLSDCTERRITVTHGTNVLVGADREKIIGELTRVLDGVRRPALPPLFWDGHAAERIVRVLASRGKAGVSEKFNGSTVVL